MTRIGYYELYECPKCQQIHIKPSYSSISIYGPPLEMGMPPDAWYAPTDLKTCQQCGEQFPFSEYTLTGHMEPLRLKEKGVDPTKLFPRLTDHPRDSSTTFPPRGHIINLVGSSNGNDPKESSEGTTKHLIPTWIAKHIQNLRSLFH